MLLVIILKFLKRRWGLATVLGQKMQEIERVGFILVTKVEVITVIWVEEVHISSCISFGFEIYFSGWG